MTRFRPPTKEQIARMKALYSRHELPDDVEIEPRIERLVEDLIGRVADKWTMLILEVLVGSGTLRFTQLSKLVGASARKC
jgi:DNA-binding HxlR family transcriptional regulator